MEKTPEQKFFNEVSRALHENDTDVIDVLMEPLDTDEPNQEVLADDATVEDEVVPDSLDDSQPDDTEPTESEKTIAQLRKELEEAKKVEHRLKSDAGRVPGLQSKLSAVEAKLDAMAAKAATRNEDGSVDDGASVDDAFDDEHFALIAETDPTLAAALKSVMGKVIKRTQTQGVDAAREVTKAFRETDEEVARQTEWNALVSVVPDAPDIFNSFAWASYKDTLTPEKLALAQSASASEVIAAITDYKAFVNKAVGSTKANEVAEERQRKLTAGVPGSSTPGARAKAPDDEKTLFDNAYAEVLKSQYRKVQ